MSLPRRRCLIALLILCLFLPGYYASSQTQIPKAGPPATAINIESKPDYSQEALVIEKFRTVHRYEKDGTGQRELMLRVKMQSEAGVQQFGQLVFPYTSANEKLDISYVRVLKADGSVVSASASDVQDLSAPLAREAPIYTDLRQKHVTVPGLRPGDVLEYRIVWLVETPVAPNHFWLAHNFVTRGVIVLDQTLEVNIPVQGKVKLKTEPGMEPEIKEQEGRQLYSWSCPNLKREDKKDEEDEDEEKEQDEAEEAEDDPDEPKPHVQMTTFQTWDEVGLWYANLLRDRVVPDERIRNKTIELLRGLDGDKEKVEALYQYVARNFRYVSLSLGQGRYQPQAATDVMTNQYGDCKDKHTLFSAMLAATGLRAYPALINSRRKIDPEIPSPGQFDHVISVIPVGNETFWADTTAEVAPFRLLSPALRDKQALVIPIEGAARLEPTPPEPPFLSTELLELEGEVDELGKLSGHLRLKVRGDSELRLRMMFRRTPQSEWKHLGYYLSMIGGVRGDIKEIKAGDPAALEEPFEIEYDVTANDFLDWSSKKLRLGLPIPSLRLSLPPVDKKKQSSKPIELGPPIEIVYRLKLSLPDKYELRAPLPVKVSRDYGEYSATYKLEGKTLIAERRLKMRQREIPAERSQDYTAFVAAARADEGQTLLLETTLAGSPSIPESVKVEELVSAAQAAAKNENFSLVEELLKRVLEKEPKHKTARRQLAWSYFAQRKYKPAEDVLREQTNINPFDDYAHNLLGRVFWQQQKYSEAETAFRKQIEVTPLDKWAHGNLGQVLVEWRKYQEAVPALEQGISLNPENEFLYISLGRAYLNLGKTEKAIEAFDKAVKIAPGPPVWNNVSYYLSEKKVHLERAQQYAESATTAVATELRNVELDRLTARELFRVASLAAYWDTLGWVHFQLGNIDIAEKYISASWSLNQHSEVADHLGQILEKRGKIEEAIRMYALGAVAERLVPESLENLERHVVDKKRSKVLLEKAEAELRESRTVKVSTGAKDLKGATEASFFVVLVPGHSRIAQVAEVKFISGDEKLRPLEAALKSANYDLIFPDETITRVIRRGTLHCQGSGGECSFIMVSPDYATPD
ncbi:MAG TPA: DUF3857 domain-containing protein [Pyrinomonadaceae bacterium]|nr:DUF3857 domain-containing protein [Pyrinomonadaceae bacterium]